MANEQKPTGVVGIPFAGEEMIQEEVKEEIEEKEITKEEIPTGVVGEPFVEEDDTVNQEPVQDFHPDEVIEKVDREPSTWEWLAAGLTKYITYNDKFFGGGDPVIGKPAYSYLAEKGEELGTSKENDPEAIGAEVMSWRDDRPAMIQSLMKDVSDPDNGRGLLSAFGSAVTKTVLLQSFPEVEEQIQKDPVTSTIYNTTYFGGSMIRDMAVGGGAVKALGLSGYWAASLGFEAVQGTSAGVTHFNELRNLESSTGKETNAVTGGMIMAGASVTAGMLTPFALQKVTNAAVKRVTLPRVLEATGSRFGRVSTETIMGAVEGSATAGTEELIRESALTSLGMEGIGGVHAESLIVAGLFSGAMRFGQNYHLLKQKNSKFKDNFVEKQTQNTKDIIEPVKDVPPDDLITLTIEQDAQVRKMNENVFKTLAEVHKLTGDPDSQRAEWRNKQKIVKKKKLKKGEKPKKEVKTGIEESVGVLSKRFAKEKNAEIVGKMREDLSSYWYQRIKNDNPDFSDAQVKELHGEKMKNPMKSWAEQVYDSKPIDSNDIGFEAHVNQEVDKLDLADISTDKVLRDHLIETKDNPEKFIEGVSEVIAQVNNYKYLDSLVETVNKYETGLGFKDTKESFDLVNEYRKSSPDTVVHSITDKELNAIGSKYYDSLRKYNEAESKVYAKAEVEVDKRLSNYVERLEKGVKDVELGRSISEDVDVALNLVANEHTRSLLTTFQKEVRASNIVESRMSYSLGNDQKQISRYVHKYKINQEKVRTYMDQLDNAQLKGEYTPDLPVKVAQDMQLTPKEVEYAKKLGNYNNHLQELTISIRDAAPESKYSILEQKMSFDSIVPDEVGSWYHPRQWNAEGKETIKEKFLIDLDAEDLVNSNFGRAVDSMALDPKFRLSPSEELAVHFNKINSSATYYRQNRMAKDIWDNHFGLKKDPETGQYRSFKESDFNKADWDQRGPLDKAVFLIKQNNDSSQRRVKILSKSGKVADELVSFVGDQASKLAIGGLNIPFHFRNSLQSVLNGVAYIYNFSPRGVFDIAKDSISSWGKFAKLIGYGGNVEKWRKSLDKLPQTELNKIRSYIANRELTNTTMEYYAIDKDSGLKSGFKEQFADLKEADSFSDGSKKALYLLRDSINHATNMQTFALNASDIAARDAAAIRAYKHFENTIKRYGWDAKSERHSQEKYNNVVKDLHLELMNEGRKIELIKLFDEGVKTGNFTDFKYAYSSAWVERLCFGYGVNDAPRYQNWLKDKPKTFRLATRFTNWAVKNRHNVVNIVSAARNKNYAPAAAAIISSGAAYAFGKLYVDEYLSEDNEWKAIYDNYVEGSTYAANIYSFPNMVTGRIENPFSLLKSGVGKIHGLFNNSAIEIAEALDIDTERTESNQTFKFKVPSLEDTQELMEGMGQFFKDAERTLGSEDEFLKGLKNNWEILTEDITLFEEE